jgi:thymidine phosphorylase
MAVVHLGGGRMHVEDTIDPKVGLADISSVGERIESGQPLCVIHAENEQDFEQASAHVISAMGLQEEPCQATDVIYEYISGE